MQTQVYAIEISVEQEGLVGIEGEALDQITFAVGKRVH